MDKPSLYGLNNSNKDFIKEDSWGKNQFNNTFPVALACYMYSKNVQPVYLKLNEKLEVEHSNISVDTLFGINPLSKEAYYAFEETYTGYAEFTDNLPRVDLVVKGNGVCLKPIEIKLTTLPDSTTYNLSEDKYGCEIVIRPDTIVYQALSIARSYKDKKDVLLGYLEPVYNSVKDWNSTGQVKKALGGIITALNGIMTNDLNLQEPLIMQPVWKTDGKCAILSENCLDIFIWSNFAFSRLYLDSIDTKTKKIERPARTAIWLFNMLYNFATTGSIKNEVIIDNFTYDTKNDKAFAISGNKTNRYMVCDELLKPRITKYEIRNIILGNGQKYLSPERRLDAVIQSDTSVFTYDKED